MSRENEQCLSEKEEARILRENKDRDPLSERIKFFVSRRQWKRGCEPRNIVLVDFTGTGRYYSVKMDGNGHFKDRFYPDGTYHPASDVFAESLFEGKIPDGIDPEEKLRKYLGF